MTNTGLCNDVVATVRSVVGTTERIALHEPQFGEAEQRLVRDCLDTGWVSTAGPYVEKFERMLEAFTGAKHAIAVVNGTAALHTCLLLAGVNRGDEVLVPALTFVATANAVSFCGAIPHFVDSAADTLGIDPAALGEYLSDVAEMKRGVCINRRSGARIAAVVPMHTFGHPVDLNGLMAVCERYGLALIEDAAESLGSYYRDAHTGTFGRLSALSFNGNKIVTTGGGGAILTNDTELARRAKHVTTTARVPHRWSFIHDEPGFNYRLPNLNAALGCAQLERLTAFVARKRELAQRYISAFAPLDSVHVFEEPKGTRSNYWLNALLLDNPDESLLQQLLEALNGAGIGARPVWTLMNRLEMYAHCPSMPLPAAESLAAQIVNLPSSAWL